MAATRRNYTAVVVRDPEGKIQVLAVPAAEGSSFESNATRAWLARLGSDSVAASLHRSSQRGLRS